jgi:hypothetical protein
VSEGTTVQAPFRVVDPESDVVIFEVGAEGGSTWLAVRQRDEEASVRVNIGPGHANIYVEREQGSLGVMISADLPGGVVEVHGKNGAFKRFALDVD